MSSEWINHSSEKENSTEDSTKDLKPVISDSFEAWNILADKLIPSIGQVFSDRAIYDFKLPYRSPSTRLVRGSSFVIAHHQNQLYLLTNAHVVKNSIDIKLRFTQTGKRNILAELVSFCPYKDIALIRTSNSNNSELISKLLQTAQPLELTDSGAIKQADEILTGGYPLGEENLQFTAGHVSGFHGDLDKDSRQLDDQLSYIQITAPINPGNSGGPSFNRQGKVIGINAAGYLFAQNVAYAIPSRTILGILPAMINSTEIMMYRPTLGFDWNPGSQQLCQSEPTCQPVQGIYIRDIYPTSSFTNQVEYEDDLCQKLIHIVQKLKIDYPAEDLSQQAQAQLISLLETQCPQRYNPPQLDSNALIKEDILQQIKIPYIYDSGFNQISKLFEKQPLTSTKFLICEFDHFGQAQTTLIDSSGNKYDPILTRKISLPEVIDMIPLGAQVEIQVIREVENKFYQVFLERTYLPQPVAEWMVREIYPKFEPNRYRYLIFSGLLIMELTQNHEDLENVDPYISGPKRFGKYLVVTKIFSGTTLDELNSIQPGDLLTQVNDIPISTIDELKQINILDQPLLELKFQNETSLVLEVSF